MALTDELEPLNLQHDDEDSISSIADSGNVTGDNWTGNLEYPETSYGDGADAGAVSTGIGSELGPMPSDGSAQRFSDRNYQLEYPETSYGDGADAGAVSTGMPSDGSAQRFLDLAHQRSNRYLARVALEDRIEKLKLVRNLDYVECLFQNEVNSQVTTSINLHSASPTHVQAQQLYNNFRVDLREYDEPAIELVTASIDVRSASSVETRANYITTIFGVRLREFNEAAIEIICSVFDIYE